MHRRSFLKGAGAASLAAATPVAKPAVRSETVRNDKVVAVDAALEPGELEPVTGRHPGVTVYLTDATLEITPRGGQPKTTKMTRGDAVFEAAQPRRVRNAGAAEVRFVRIEFVGAGLDQTWGTTGLSPNYKLLLENRFTRVYDIRIPAGASEPQHTHHDRVVVCLSGATLKHLMPDGREEPSTLKTGESVWRRGGTHIGQNLGKTDLWVIAVEPK
jgi:quercetin dioxygenase-like cupin family protein